MADESEPGVAERLAALERRLGALEGTAPPPPLSADAFWALIGLKERADASAVLFTGTVTLPTGEHFEWQQAALGDDLLDLDWPDLAGAFAALGHPVRLLLVREILGGTHSVAGLQEHEGLGTTGQLYHHLRQLVSAGWLQATGRGRYVVPAARVVPLLVALATTQSP